METFNINYSKKKIPLPSEKEYITQLISKVESVTKRMRWKALAFQGKLDSSNEKEHFGFKSNKCPPAVEELSDLESDLIEMVRNIEFRAVRNNFLSKMQKDIKIINATNELLITADKSTNIYKMNKENYEKHLIDNITKTYKKSNKNKVNKINRDAKKIAEQLGIGDRVEIMQESEAFLTVKDHKENFPNTLSFRLLNPSKSDIGKISKSFLDQINRAVIDHSKVNQWKNTAQVIQWFKDMKDKERSTFLNFDVENFYPSISLSLFTNAINPAKSITPIPEEHLSISMQSRKTLLFHKTEPCVKKSLEEDFDVPMGCYDGAEVCELVGSFILSKLSNVTRKENIGLYRDDGLGVFQNLPRSSIERKKKEIVKVFKDCGLSITIETNLQSAVFLDVTSDMQKNIFKP